MILQLAKRVFFFVLFMLILMAWAAPSLAQIIESEGYASWYNRGAHGSTTASGEYYDHSALTAAHPFLPFDSMVRVTRMDTGKSVVVRINDRMNSGPGHIIDLSGAATEKLGLQDVNVARVRLDLEEPVDLIRIQERYAARDQQERTERQSLAETKARPRESSRSESVTLSTTGTQDLAVATPIRTASAQEDGYRYTLQVGVFASHPAASAFAGEFENGWVREVNDSGETMYRVYFDRFSQEQPARSAQAQLKESGRDSFLREIL